MPTNDFNTVNEINVIHTNCQSAMNKKSEISALVDHHNPHILALSEFGAAANVSDGELGINGKENIHHVRNGL